MRAARRAGCTPEDVPLARRKTCRVRAVRDAQVRPAVRAGPFSSRPGLPELRGRAAGREALRQAWPPGAQGVPRSPKGTCQTLEPKPGRKEAKVPPGFAVREASVRESEVFRARARGSCLI